MSHPNSNPNNQQNGKKRRRNRKGNRNQNDGNNRSSNNEWKWNKPSKPIRTNNSPSGPGCCADEQFHGKPQKLAIYRSPYKECYFDSHCHLDWILFKSGYALRDFPSFYSAHLSSQFGGCVTNSCAPDSIRSCSELINATHHTYKHVYGTFGIHPHNAKEWNTAVQEKVMFALKTGQYSVDQNSKSSSAVQAQKSENTWMCFCGHCNATQNIFCEQCAFEPSKEYLENVELLQMVQRMDAQNDKNAANASEEKQNEQKKELQKSEPENNAKIQNAKVVAVGECGLDYHYNRSPQDMQRKAFIAQIEMAKQLELPLVVHAREAEQDTMQIMKRYCPKEKPIHLHCFSDSLQYAQYMLNEFPNLYIGFTGAITFKNAHQNRDTVKHIPLNRLLLETDGPYMCPMPYRGKVAHPGHIPLVAEQIASVHGIKNVEVVLKQCRLNATNVYGV